MCKGKREKKPDLFKLARSFYIYLHDGNSLISQKTSFYLWQL
jgi:hypothetical protein